jgi:hypothetical protein
VLGIACSNSLRSRGIHSFITSPGNVQSNITQNALSGLLLLIVLWVVNPVLLYLQGDMLYITRRRAISGSTSIC